MKLKLKSVLAITCSIVLGIICSTAISGCQPPNAPRPTPAVKNSNTTEAAAAPKKAVDAQVGPAKSDPAKPEVEKATDPKPAENVKPAENAKPADNGAAKPAKSLPVAKVPSENPDLAKGDWNQWGGNSIRNNVPVVDQDKVPLEFAPGEFDRETGKWDPSSAKNIKWVAQMGSQTYGNTVIAGGRVYVGTNNGAGYLKRYPAEVDLGCLIALDEKTGKFLWQHSSEKLPTGRVHDWPLMGICCSPLVEGDRLWFVTSRGEVKCLDTDGYYDDEDDGPVKAEMARLFDIARGDEGEEDAVAPAVNELNDGKLPESFRKRFADAGFELGNGEVTVSVVEAGKSWKFNTKAGDVEREAKIVMQGPRLVAMKQITTVDKEEADTIWSLDMMKQLGVSQHNMCSCSVTSWGDLLFVNTSNGVHDDHKTIPAPEAPSFVCMNKNTGDIYWSDNSPGGNILHGQWSSPAVGIIGDVPQVIFGGGDGWVYGFKADQGKDGKPELLWKFDINEKDAELELGAQGTKNDIIATPIIYDNKVYFATGQDPEHGEGVGIFWCIDPTKRGDISENSVVTVDNKPVPPKRVQSAVESEGDRIIPNPNSGVVWKLTQDDWDGNGEIDDFKERFHRGIGTAAVKDDILYVADFAGMFWCIDAQTGKVHWGYDMLAASWGSALIAGDKVFACDEDGDIAIFNHSKDPKEAMIEIEIDGEKKLYPINAKQPDAESRPEVTNMANSVYSSPIIANDVLWIANKDHLFAIQVGAEPMAGEAVSAETSKTAE